jgi:DNA end-binding protein Ku
VIKTRTSWKGTLGIASFITVPVGLAGATGSNTDIETHQHAPDGSRIQYKKVSAATGQEVASSDIKMGYDCPDGTVVFLTDEDFEEAFGAVSREAQIITFTDAGNVPDIAKDKPFFIQPSKGGERTYAMLVQALRRSGKVAIVKFGIRRRKRLAAISPTPEGYLILEQLTWDQDIRTPDFAPPMAEFSDKELSLCDQLIEGLSSDYDHSLQRDDSQDKLNALIESRRKAGQVVMGTPSDKGSEPVPGDLAALLEASVNAQKAKAEPAKPARRRKSS